MTTWTQNRPGGDRWTYDERWSVRLKGGRWFVFWRETRLKPGVQSADKAKVLAEKLIADEARAEKAEQEFEVRGGEL